VPRLAAISNQGTVKVCAVTGRDSHALRQLLRIKSKPIEKA
jgi:hypothetical protein